MGTISRLDNYALAVPRYLAGRPSYPCTPLPPRQPFSGSCGEYLEAAGKISLYIKTIMGVGVYIAEFLVGLFQVNRGIERLI